MSQFRGSAPQNVSLNRISYAAINSISGSISGLTAAVALTPLDVIKIRLIIHGKHTIPTLNTSNVGRLHSAILFPLDIAQTIRYMLKTEGIRSLYRGLGTTLIGYIPNWAIYFTLYDYMKNNMLKHNGYVENTNLINIISAMSAGAVASTVTNPLWVVKTRMQAGKTVRYNSTWHALNTILREEGPQALWRGLAPSLLGLVHIGIQFSLYENLKQKFEQKRGTKLIHITDVMLASMTSKLAASMIAYPHEVLRSRLHDNGHSTNKKYKNMREVITKIYQEEGVSGFYKGMATNCIRVVPQAIITLTTYELCLRFLSRYEV
jgi:solute carrier family 25 folate transporter 32